MKSIYNISLLIVIAALGLMGCKKDFANPNDATADQTLNSPVGLTGVAVGLQKQYSTSRAGALYNLVCANGFSTFELSNRNTGNVDETNLFNGGSAVDGNNSVVGNLWASNLKVIFDANNVINNAANLGDKGFASGLIGYATIFKALAYGSLSQFWEKVPDTVGIGLTPTFMDRQAGYAKAIAAIDKALATIAANPMSSAILANLPPGIEIPNTLLALKARYLTFSGSHAAALTAANAVNLAVKSELRYDNNTTTGNPIAVVSTTSNNVFQVKDSTMGLPIALRPTVNDKRVGFYMVINNAAAPRWRINGFGAALGTSWPVYLPSEVTLMKAESYARANDLPNAVIELNKVLTKTAAGDPFGIGADLPAYAGANTQPAILEEIYRNRCIELYMQGWKLEDMRRFGRSNAPNVEKNRNFYPYPFRERDNNKNTPADPAF